MPVRSFDGINDRLDTGLSQTKGSTQMLSMYTWIKKASLDVGLQTVFGSIYAPDADQRLQLRQSFTFAFGVYYLVLDMWGKGIASERIVQIALPRSPLGECVFIAYVNDISLDRARFYWGFTTDTIVEVDTSEFFIGGIFTPTEASEFKASTDPDTTINIGALGREPAFGGAQEYFNGIILGTGIAYDAELSLADLKNRSNGGIGVGVGEHYWPITGDLVETGIETIYGTTVVGEPRCGTETDDSSGGDSSGPAPDEDAGEARVTQARKGYVWRLSPEIPAASCAFVPVIRILRAVDFLPVMEVDLYATLRYTRRWTDLDDFEMKLSLDSEVGARLGSYLLPTDGSDQEGKYLLAVAFNQLIDFVGFIDVIDDFEGGGKDELTIAGYGLDRILTDRILAPAAAQEFDAYDDPVETIIKTMVDRHIKSPGTFTTLIPSFNESQREVPPLIIAANKELGPTVVYNGRFQRLIEGIRDVIQAGEGTLGYTLQLVQGTLLFDVVPGNDRSLSVVFSPDYDNVSEFRCRRDGLNFASHVVMGGQGTGATKLLETVFTPDSLRFGIERREAYLDASDADTTSKLDDKGKAFLQDKGRNKIFTIKKLPGSRPCYKEDWDVGDFVGLRNKKRGVNEVRRIEEVTVSCAAGQVTGFDLVLAKASPIGPLAQLAALRQGATAAVARQ